MIVALPSPPPVTIPDDKPTGAVAGALLVHAPVPELVSVVVVPRHILVMPVIGAGNAFTVIVSVLAHPVLNV